MSSFKRAEYLEIETRLKFQRCEAELNSPSIGNSRVRSQHDRNTMNQIVSSPVTVGFLPLPTAQNHKILAATAMAIAEINQGGGVLGHHLHLEGTHPYAATPPDETLLTDSLIGPVESLIEQQNINTFFGAVDPFLLPLIEQHNVLVWSAFPPQGFAVSRNIFTSAPCPNQRVETALKWLKHQQKLRCYLLRQPTENPDASLIKSQWSEEGVLLVGETVFSAQTAVSDLFEAIAQSQANIILNTCGRESLPFYQAYSNHSNESLPILAFHLTEADLQQLPPTETQRHYFVSSYCRGLQTPQNQQFLESWQTLQASSQRTETQTPEAFIDETFVAAYNQVYLWKQAVELAGTFDVEQVRIAAYGMTYPGPGGLVQVAPNQYCIQPGYISRHQQDEPSLVVWKNPRPVAPLPALSADADFYVSTSQEATLLAQLEEEKHQRQTVENTFREYVSELLIVLRSLPECIFVTNIEGCYLRIAPTNPKNAISPDVIGKTLDDVYPPEKVQQFLGIIQEAINRQSSVELEYCLEAQTPPNRTDQDLWFRAVVSAIAPDAVIWIVRDITTQKQSEQELERERQELQAQFDERSKALVASNDQLIAEIVERQQTENALTAAKNQLQAILEAVPGIVSWISADLRYLGVNRHLAQTFGLDPQDFVGKDIGFLNASSEFREFVREFFATPAREDFREITNIVEGKSRTFLIVAQKYEEGRAAFTVGIDVTERQQAVEALERSKDQLQAVLDAVPGIVSWISSDLHYLGVNRHLAQTFGLSPDSFHGRPLGFLDASEDFNDFVKDFFEQPEHDSFTEVETTVEGEVRNYLIAAQKYDEGRAAFTVGIDVTERQQALNELARSKDQLQAVLEAVPGIVSWISSDLHYLGVNRHLARTFNLPVSAFVGKHIGFLQASEDFNDFVREFFAKPEQDSFREVEAIVNGETRNFIIAAQKYDDGQAAFTVGIDVTERQQALEAFQKAEAKYRNIFENSIEGIFQTTLDGHYISANPALARIYGYDSPEELMNSLTSVQDQLYLDENRRLDFVKLISKQGGVVGFESQIRRKDGQVRWISENARLVQDTDTKLIYYEGTVEDITERKEAEEALRQLNEKLEQRVQERTTELQQLNLQLLMEIGERERIESALRTSEAELKALFAAMTDVITVFDEQGRYAKIVTTSSEVVYSPHEDLIGKSVYEVLAHDKADIFMENIREALEQEKTVNVEYNLTLSPNDHEPPEELWFAASVSPLPNKSVIWVARNITERKRVLDALQEAEENYRSIFENAAEGIFQSTREGEYLSANPALVKMYGYSSFEEMASMVRKIDEDLYLEPQLREVFREELERVGSITGFKAQVRRKDGTLIWTSENARVVRDDAGNIAYYEGTVADITKQKQAEDALYQEREKSDRLLLNILPRAIAERLKQDEKSIAERFDSVSILFADIVDFTTFSAEVEPTELVDSLNEIFSAFDQLAEWYNLEKIKTIGDSYMVAGGIPSTTEYHAEAIADMALDMQLAITRFCPPHKDRPFRLRIGINTGQVVAGVIGIRKFIYDLWGDTVNVASRMESQGVPDMIQVTEETYHLLKDQFFFEKRGEVDVKGKGVMTTYWLRGRR